MKNQNRREFLISAGAVVAAASIRPAATFADDRPRFTDRSLNILFSRDARGRELSQEQINRLAEAAAQDLRSFLARQFDLTDGQAECQRQIPDDAIRRLSEFLRTIPAESGHLTAEIVTPRDGSPETWLLTITTAAGANEMYFPGRRPD